MTVQRQMENNPSVFLISFYKSVNFSQKSANFGISQHEVIFCIMLKSTDSQLQMKNEGIFYEGF